VAESNRYEPRRPEQTLVYAVIARELETFLALRREQDRAVPRFVEEEFRAFLDCGVLSRGFLRLRCGACGKDRIVGFSCKRRGVCSSCGGRRMAATAAHPRSRVFPDVPVRQWVLSLPFAVRYRLAFDAALLRAASRSFARSVFGWLRARARELGVFRGQCGAVTFVQRFSSDLRLNPHFHMAAIEGVHTSTEVGPEFHELPPPATAMSPTLSAMRPAASRICCSGPAQRRSGRGRPVDSR
jgi:hypothetical protein